MCDIQFRPHLCIRVQFSFLRCVQIDDKNSEVGGIFRRTLEVIHHLCLPVDLHIDLGSGRHLPPPFGTELDARTLWVWRCVCSVRPAHSAPSRCSSHFKDRAVRGDWTFLTSLSKLLRLWQVGVEITRLVAAPEKPFKCVPLLIKPAA